MEPAAYHNMFRQEDHHWWFRSRRELFRRLWQRWNLAGILPSPRVLDLGCGTGANLAWVKERVKARGFGLDYAELALSCCRQRGLPRLTRGEAGKLPFRDASFDVVHLFDVLYHRTVPEALALAEILRILRPGGWLLLTDCAFESLKSGHDVAMQAARRYRLSLLRRLLAGAGFSVRHGSYFYCVIFPGVALVRLWHRISRHSPADDISSTPPWLNRWLAFLGRVEAFLATYAYLPWGTTVCCVAQKQTENPALSLDSEQG